MKYLLNQSDIFSHFGMGTSNPSKSSSNKVDLASPSKHRSRVVSQDMDDDEKEIMDEECEGPRKNSHSLLPTTILTQQPNIIVGRKLK